MRRAAWLVGAALLAAAPFVLDPYYRYLVTMMAVYAVVAVGLNLLTGGSGQISLGHGAFLAIGAYTTAILVDRFHLLPYPLAVLVGGVATAAAGLLLGLPSLRLKGDYLAIVTLGFAEIFRLVIATAQVTKEPIGEAWSKIGGEGGVVGPFFHAIAVSLSSLGGQNGYHGVRPEQGVPL